jgi:hypothetical protein
MALSDAGSTVSNAFVTQFADDVVHLSQQKLSKLAGSVRTVRGVNGSVYKFNTLGKGGYIKNKSRFEDITVMSDSNKSLGGSGSYVGGTAAHATVTATLNNYVAGEYVDDFDMFKVNFDFRQTYAESIAAALARAYDNEIIAQLDAASPSTTVTASGGLTKAKFLEIAEGLNSNDVDTNDRFIVMSPAALTDLLSDSGVTTAADGPISNTALATGYIPNFLGFNVIVSNLLNTASTGVRKCYAFQKNSLGLAIGKDVTAMINYVPQKVSYLVAGEFSAGAAVIDTTGVVLINVTE